MKAYNENNLWMLMDSVAARGRMEQGGSKPTALTELIKIASELDSHQLETLLSTAQGLKSWQPNGARVKKTPSKKQFTHE